MKTSIVLPPDLTAPAHSRAHLRDCLPKWGLAHLLDDAELVTSELVANAVRHGATPVTLTVTVSGGLLTIAVADADPHGTPIPRPADASATGGRGMAIVASMAQRWGCTQDVASKVVWAELALQRPAADSAADC